MFSFNTQGKLRETQEFFLGEVKPMDHSGSLTATSLWCHQPITLLLIEIYLTSCLLLVIWCAQLPQSCLTLFDPMECKPARLLCPWDSPGKNTGMGCHSLLQGIFPTQGLNLGLPHCGQIIVWTNREVLWTTIWPRNPTTGHILRENNSKRHM